MKKIETTSVKYLVIMILATSIAGMILWPLFDLFWCAVISHTEFVYSIVDHLVEPIIFGCIFGIVLWVLEKKKAKKK